MQKTDGRFWTPPQRNERIRKNKTAMENYLYIQTSFINNTFTQVIPDQSRKSPYCYASEAHPRVLMAKRRNWIKTGPQGSFKPINERIVFSLRSRVFCWCE